MFIKPTRDRALRAKKSALDAVRAAILLADAELKITHANPAALSSLRDAAADLQGALPGFNVAGLIGTSIEVFHKHPTLNGRSSMRHTAPRSRPVRTCSTCS